MDPVSQWPPVSPTLLLRYIKRGNEHRLLKQHRHRNSTNAEYRKQINRKRSPSQDSDARYAEDTRSILRREYTLSSDGVSGSFQIFGTISEMK